MSRVKVGVRVKFKRGIRAVSGSGGVECQCKIKQGGK
jgi:hypothetical protein